MLQTLLTNVEVLEQELAVVQKRDQELIAAGGEPCPEGEALIKERLNQCRDQYKQAVRDQLEAETIRHAIAATESALGWAFHPTQKDENGLNLYVTGLDAESYNKMFLFKLRQVLLMLGYTNFEQYVEKYQLYTIGYK